MKNSKFNGDPFKDTFGSLENLVDKISDVLGCPVTIEDSNHRLLAYSSHEQHTDTARIATIIGRRVPEKVINNLWKQGVIQKLNLTDDPIRISEIASIGLGNRVAIAIRKKNEVLGYIWVLEPHSPLSEKELQLVKQAAQTAKNQLLQLQVHKMKKEESYQEFFWQLLTGHLKSHFAIKQKIEKLGILPPSQVAVLVFQFSAEITVDTEKHLSYLVTTTQQLQASLSVIDRNELILLVAPLPMKDSQACISHFIKDFIAQMEKRYQISHIKAGYGNIYDDYEKVEQSYQEALTVLRLKNQFPDEIGDIYSYGQLGIYRYLHIIIQQKQLDRYENSSLAKLVNYDRLNRTQLVETLEIFLNNDSNAIEAAKELHIHANTLNYRLKRLSDIGNIDLRNPNQKMTLYLDIKIMKLEQEAYL